MLPFGFNPAVQNPACVADPAPLPLPAPCLPSPLCPQFDFNPFLEDDEQKAMQIQENMKCAVANIFPRPFDSQPTAGARACGLWCGAVARGAWRVARAQLGAAFCLCVRLQRQPSTSSLLSSLRT